ncbi:adenylate kinase [Austwickia sp. TVS 96-490-7B]|uniref:adenylate kinase n=1 Tax=Austwickia sp. TVS 96-490-7B TaxID=2830843 RepID=UPI001C5733A5|nr:adenylate kinase [Austwickia sp. TVS 96-490-7B]MBW3085742.1 adenylate kinase [Austwickia sp. TVS 96-490-7B]
MRLLILGPPGAGKGTQASRIADVLGIPAISTGEIFRRNIKEKTPLGIRVKGIIEAGQYVPDEVTNEIVFDRLSEPDAKNGYLLDGYPRTVDQAWALREFHWTRDTDLDHVLELEVPDQKVVERLLKRSEIEGRSDDNEQVIRERLKIYHEQTTPISSMARDRGLLRSVDGEGTVDQVFDRCMAALQQSANVPPRPLRVV